MVAARRRHLLVLSSLVATAHPFRLRPTRPDFFALTMTKRKASGSASAAATTKSKKASPAKARLAETTTVSTNDSSSNTSPWYTIFTKDDQLYHHYMSTEWGYETRGDDALFELLALEGAQSGLSWRTILHKRHLYRQWFHNFHVETVAAMTTEHVQAILAAEADQAVVRHKGKIESVLHNAQRIMEMRQEAKAKGESTEDALDRFLWSFVNDQPILNGHIFDGTLQGMPGTSAESIAMSKALKKLGFKFVGPTTCYSLMQSAGMVLDHPMNCPEGRQAYERLQQRPGGFQDRRPSSARGDGQL
jgi:DNA-3-methyladenine glycosylase I